MKQLLYFSFLLLFLQACSKSHDDKAAGTADVTNRLNFIIDDNLFNFSAFNAGLGRTSYRVALAGPGPYTVLVPDNNAFMSAGYANDQAVLTESADVLDNMIGYHITNGTWELDKLPFAFNQEIESIGGAKLYVTRWVRNGDTVVTINGTRVLSYNLQASNGLIQVLNAVLQPLVHQKLTDAIAADPQLTYFNVALQRAGMKGLLAGDPVYTVFAPNNAAFVAAGFPSIDSINGADSAGLRSLLEYTMFPGRKFVYDYILTTGVTGITQQAMLNGDNITVTLVKTGVDYTGITVKGVGNAAGIPIQKANVLAGNGVVHITSQVIRENQ